MLLWLVPVGRREREMGGMTGGRIGRRKTVYRRKVLSHH